MQWIFFGRTLGSETVFTVLPAVFNQVIEMLSDLEVLKMSVVHCYCRCIGHWEIISIFEMVHFKMKLEVAYF